MLKRNTLETFASLPVDRIANAVVNGGIAGKKTGAAVLDYLAANHPHKHAEVIATMARNHSEA